MWGALLVLLYFGMALAAAVVIMQPDRFAISRSATIDASARDVFARIDDLRDWGAWFSFAPANVKLLAERPAAGVGAACDWPGDGTFAAGGAEIVESQPFDKVTIRLQPRKPFASPRDLCFVLTAESARRTKVTCTLSGRNNLLAKAMNLLGRDEKKRGCEIQAGLARLGAIANA